MTEKKTVYISRTQIASAQALIRLLAEDEVNENGRKIARATPNQKMVLVPRDEAAREAS